MKPLRTGLGAGLLAGAAGAANKLLADRRAGTLERTAGPVRVGPKNGVGDPRKVVQDGVKDDRGSFIARRATRRAVANRPAWVVAPPPGVAGTNASSPPRVAPAAGPRKMPSLDQLKAPSAKSVGASVGKYAFKQVGKAVGKVAADRVGKAIELIEVLEQVIASASDSAHQPDPTPAAPITIKRQPSAALGSAPTRPGPSPAAGADPTMPPSPPKGTLVSVRKRERGPRVVVGPTASPPLEAEAGETLADVATDEAASDAVVADAIEVVVELVQAGVETPAAGPDPTDAPAAPPAPVTNPTAAPRPPAVQKSPAEKAPVEKPAAKKAPAPKPVADKPVADKPVADKPVADKPVADKPVADKPAEKTASRKRKPAKPQVPDGADSAAGSATSAAEGDV